MIWTKRWCSSHIFSFAFIVNLHEGSFMREQKNNCVLYYLFYIKSCFFTRAIIHTHQMNRTQDGQTGSDHFQQSNNIKGFWKDGLNHKKSLVHRPWEMNTECVSHAAHERVFIIFINTKIHQKLTDWEAHVESKALSCIATAWNLIYDVLSGSKIGKHCGKYNGAEIIRF